MAKASARFVRKSVIKDTISLTRNTVRSFATAGQSQNRAARYAPSISAERKYEHSVMFFRP